MRIYIILASIFILAFISCNRSKSKIKPNDNTPKILNLSHEKVFYLDSKTTAMAKSISYIEEDSMLAVFTRSSNQISFFDYNSGKIVKTAILRTLSPYEIYIQNKDTIVVFTINNRTLYLLNGKLEIQKKFSFALKDDLKTFTVNPGFSQTSPIIFNNEEMFLSCWGLGEYPDVVKTREDRPIIVEFNTTKRTRNYYSGYPIKYIRNNMGSFNNWILKHTYNPYRKEIVVAFTATNDIIIFNIDTKSERSININSKYFDTIPLPHPGKDRYYSSQNESYYHYVQQPCYGNILYDKYRHIYYRFVLHGVEKPDLSKGVKMFFDKKMSIIVTDEDFNIIGETQPYSGYYAQQSFVTHCGLHVLKFNNDENKATYSVFTFNEAFDK